MEDKENCKHEKVPEPFFDETNINHSSDIIKQIYPRIVEKCPDCGSTVIKYASFMHYIAGDW